MNELRIPSWIEELAVYEPGRPMDEVAREYGFASEADIVKLASNENPLGPSPKARAAMRKAAAEMHRYPDGGSYYLRRALAERLGLEPDRIVLGEGSNEMIVLLCHIFLQPGDEVVCSACAFAIYPLAARLYRARSVETPMRGFTHDLDAMRAAIGPRTRLVFIGNPNNPTGTMVGADELDRFIAAAPPELPVVIDEAYIELLPPERRPDTLRHVREGRSVFVLRTFSKAYGLAGLRLGYALGPASGIAALNRVRQPFNVSAIAQAAALAALDDEAHVARAIRVTASGLRLLERGCRARGLEYVPSAANFMLIRTGRGREVFQALLRRGVIVRPMDGYGLPEYIRVSVGTRAELERFWTAWDQYTRDTPA
jgi:histidinol-phosphate aminotransferase